MVFSVRGFVCLSLRQCCLTGKRKADKLNMLFLQDLGWWFLFLMSMYFSPSWHCSSGIECWLIAGTDLFYRVVPVDFFFVHDNENIIGGCTLLIQLILCFSNVDITLTRSTHLFVKFKAKIIDSFQWNYSNKKKQQKTSISEFQLCLNHCMECCYLL